MKKAARIALSIVLGFVIVIAATIVISIASYIIPDIVGVIASIVFIVGMSCFVGFCIYAKLEGRSHDD